jgi:chromosomal replication initiation ATPase DnaA
MLHLLLITMKRTQRDLYNARVTVAEALDVLQNLFTMMNTNFAELKEEYGGSSMRLRDDVRTIGDPPLVL